ncbi:MAG: ABC1 kinase family protein [Candidatus Adiutrix sp.]
MISNDNSQNSALARLSRIGRFYRHMGRMTEIGTTLVKFGFDDLLIRVGLTDLLDHVRQLVGLSVLDDKQLDRPQRVRLAMQELGVVFIKWGQYLSTRDDLVPESYLHEFTLLQNSVVPVPFEDIERVMNHLTSTGEVRTLSPEPLAAASIGQVHEAVLADGSPVVVKVRRPGLKKQVTTDLEILMELAILVEKHLPIFASTRPTVVVAEFSRGLLAELDFTQEATNIERFGRFYANHEKVNVPRLYRRLCSERVLVMEKVEGLKFNDVEGLKKADYSLKELATLGATVVFEQIMVFGYFHGDPHPGNLLVQPGLKVALLDFGLVGRLNRRTRDILLNMTLGVVHKKPRAVTGALLKLVKVEGDEPIDRERLEVEVEMFMEAYTNRPIKEINLGKVLSDVVDIAAQYRLSLPADLMLLVKALSQVEGLGLRLDPDFDITAAARPFVLAQYRRRFSPMYWSRRLRDVFFDAWSFIETFPNDLRPMYNMLRSGRFKFDMHMEGLDDLRQTVDRASYRLSFAVVLASLVIGSSVVIHADIPPKWHGLPILGLVGFMGAAMVGFWLLYDFLKNRRF